MAIAAQEMGQLSELICSFFNSPGKWGSLLSKWVYVPSAFPLGSEALLPERIKEYPWPQLRRQLSSKWNKKVKHEPLPYFQAFEKYAAKRLRSKKSKARIAVAAETCALGYFEQAKELGMSCVLDAHGIPNRFLDNALKQAAEEFQLSIPAPSDSSAMEDHKEQERELADKIIYCSELQRQIWISLGVAEKKTVAAPLWVDTTFWKPLFERKERLSSDKIKVAAVGAGSLGKGLPYLVKGLEELNQAVSLTLVGGLAHNMRNILEKSKIQARLLPYLTRLQLRDFFSTQDLLVMPSIGDSFGFVAIEAMACGVPVIVTSHCGVPVPKADWRVTAHSSVAITERIQQYIDNPTLLVADSSTALNFVSEYSPEKYRKRIQDIYQEFL